MTMPNLMSGSCLARAAAAQPLPPACHHHRLGSTLAPWLTTRRSSPLQTKLSSTPWAPPRRRRPPVALRDSDDLAGRIDHTLLKADATQAAIETLCAEARENGFASVCVNTRWVPLAAESLTGSDVMVCTVVGFPLGAMSRRAKAAETAIAVEEGADEVDMVLDIGGLLSGDLASVYEDMVAVVDAARPKPVKVILGPRCSTTSRRPSPACWPCAPGWPTSRPRPASAAAGDGGGHRADAGCRGRRAGVRPPAPSAPARTPRP